MLPDFSHTHTHTLTISVPTAESGARHGCLPENLLWADDVGIDNAPPCESDWLNKWMTHTANSPTTPLVPLQACQIATPLIASAWRTLLIAHPHRELINFFLSGITHGFRVGFNYTSPALQSVKKNLQSATEHPEVTDQYIQKEVDESRVIGPFSSKEVQRVHLSRFGVIPKSHQPNKWRLIVDLSSLTRSR